MNTTEFKKILTELNVAYGDKRFPLTDDVKNIWFKYLKDCNADIAIAAVEEYIAHNSYTPSIADILALYGEMSLAKSAELKQAKSIYEFTASLYPGGGRSEATEKLFGEITGWDIGECYKVFDYVKGFVESNEKSGNTEIATLEECLRGMPR